MKTITTHALWQNMQIAPVALFDVRGDLEFEAGHIPGAMTAPLGSLTFRVASVSKPDSFVAVYSTGDDGLAERAATRLEDLRMTNVHVYTGGIKDWMRAGHPIKESPFPKVQGRGEVQSVRPLIVDRETAYGGAFKGKPSDGVGGG